MTEKHENTRPQATYELRFEEREVRRDGKLQVIRILQQLWIMGDGSTQWRDVPCVRIRRGAST